MKLKSLVKGLFATAALTASAASFAGYESLHFYSSGYGTIVEYKEGYVENPDQDSFTVTHDEVAQRVTITNPYNGRHPETGEFINTCFITPETTNSSGEYLYNVAVELSENLHLMTKFSVRFSVKYADRQCQQLSSVEYKDWWRTIVFIYGQTQPGQDMFVRGGIDHGYAAAELGRDCTSSNYECAIPIRHLNYRNDTTSPWKSGDEYLDWYGVESLQSSQAEGSALDWTTDYWPESWGAARIYEEDGSGETELNTYGQHYWILEVEMDCSKTANGVFELKSFISNGPGWESDVSQPGAPWVSGNHFAECGKKNVFRRGESNPVEIKAL